MLKVLKAGKIPVLAFVCTECREVFIASLDECDKDVIMGVSTYRIQCPGCCQWVPGGTLGVDENGNPVFATE